METCVAVAAVVVGLLPPLIVVAYTFGPSAAAVVAAAP